MIEVELVEKAYRSSLSARHPRLRVEVLVRRVVHESLHSSVTRGVKPRRATALMQFLARRVVPGGPHAGGIPYS